MAFTVVSRSLTTVEIDTFITVLSSTITNWAKASIKTIFHFRIVSSITPFTRNNQKTSGEPEVFYAIQQNYYFFAFFFAGAFLATAFLAGAGLTTAGAATAFGAFAVCTAADLKNGPTRYV